MVVTSTRHGRRGRKWGRDVHETKDHIAGPQEERKGSPFRAVVALAPGWTSIFPRRAALEEARCN